MGGSPSWLSVLLCLASERNAPRSPSNSSSAGSLQDMAEKDYCRGSGWKDFPPPPPPLSFAVLRATEELCKWVIFSLISTVSLPSASGLDCCLPSATKVMGNCIAFYFLLPQSLLQNVCGTGGLSSVELLEELQTVCLPSLVVRMMMVLVPGAVRDE